MSTLAARAGRSLRDLLPLATAFVALIVDLVPVAGLGPAAVAPSVALAVVYFWSLSRPDRLSSFDLFALGLLADLVAATPLGTTSLTFLVIRWLVAAPGRPTPVRSFPVAWLGFAAAMVIVQWLRFAVMGFVHGAIFPLAPLAVEGVLTIALYPAVAMAMQPLLPLLGGETDAPAR